MTVQFFFFIDTATAGIYTLSLHDALPIFPRQLAVRARDRGDRRDRVHGLHRVRRPEDQLRRLRRDRKSTRLNSSHGYISYAVFCLKKKKKNIPQRQPLYAEVSVHECDIS